MGVRLELYIETFDGARWRAVPDEESLGAKLFGRLDKNWTELLDSLRHVEQQGHVDPEKPETFSSEVAELWSDSPSTTGIRTISSSMAECVANDVSLHYRDAAVRDFLEVVGEMMRRKAEAPFAMPLFDWRLTIRFV